MGMTGFTTQVGRSLWRIILAMVMLAVATPSSAGEFLHLISFSGFDYESDGSGGTDPTPDSLLAVGDTYEVLGIVHAFGGELEALADFGSYQYTVVLSGLTVVHRSSYLYFMNAVMAPGRMDVDRDPLAGGTAADFGVDPRGAARASFTDGELVLSAPVTEFNLTFNQSTHDGIWDSSAEADAGSWLGELLPTLCTMSSAGQIGIAGVEVPGGYGHAVEGVYTRVCGFPVRPETWGGLKSLYR